MSKVDDVVNQIRKDYEASTSEDPGFQDDQAKNALDALAGLTAAEFEEAFNRLDFTVASYKDNVREQLVLDAGDLRDKPEYKGIIDALETGDPSAVVNAKGAAEPPTFERYGLEPFRKAGEHAHYVDLPAPAGASAALKILIKDIEFTMQWGFDTLGAGDPEAAPDFTAVLEGGQVTNLKGWSGIREAYLDLKKDLDNQRAAETKALTDVKVNTSDAAILKSDTFKKLIRIKDELASDLEYEIPNTTHTGDKITESSGGPPNSEVQVTVFEKNTDKNSESFGKYYLTAEAEQRYYVRAIDRAAADWEREYANATEAFQKKADRIDNGNNGNGSSPGGSGNGGGSPYPVSNGGDAYPVQDGSAPYVFPAEDLSSMYDDSLTGSIDTAGSDGSDPVLGSGVGDTASSADIGDTVSGTDLSSAVQAALQNGVGTGTKTGTGTTTSNVAPAAASSSTDTIGPMMMNALSQMANQQNRPLPDNRGYADRDSRETRQRERNRTTPTGTTNPTVQAPPPGVAAPAYPGTPPPDFQIDGKTVTVSQPVWDALHKQVQNVALTAEDAYGGTAGELTATNPPATPAGPGELRTGDILKWEKHSALIVKDQNVLYVVDNGHLVPLDPNDPPLRAKYGNFTGYIHPTGLDGVASGSPGSPEPRTATTSTAGQPAGPPPVSPPQI
ncbi:hypothetical protein [Nocardia amamiensis]|uniref:hypothetical protein n=1 Tax=Nocardia amamiensis TaxID=404578 RepID=UPI000836A009|nr:hypothetical protein [Nocardia amamiensis]